MARPKKPKESKEALNPPNPTGKGGLQDRPHDRAPIAVANAALRAMEAAKKEQKAILFREHQALFKRNLMEIALSGEKENNRLQATTTILSFIADGNPEKILEKSHEDEFGTLDEKLKQMSDAFIERSMKVTELEKEIERLKKLVKE